MSGATTGKVSILKCKNTDKYYQNQRVGYFKRNIQYNYDFVSTIVRSDLFKEQLMSVLVAGAQPNVSSKEIDSFEFVIPLNIEEQKKIGRIFCQPRHPHHSSPAEVMLTCIRKLFSLGNSVSWEN